MAKKEDEKDDKPSKKGCPVKGCDEKVSEKGHPTIPHLKTISCPEHGDTNVAK